MSRTIIYRGTKKVIQPSDPAADESMLFIPPPLEGSVGSEWRLKRCMKREAGERGSNTSFLPNRAPCGDVSKVMAFMHECTESNIESNILRNGLYKHEINGNCFKSIPSGEPLTFQNQSGLQTHMVLFCMPIFNF